MKAEDLVALSITAVFVSFLLLEAVVPARSYPARRLWRLQGVLQFVVVAMLATAIPLALNPEWLAAHRLLDLTGLGTAGGAVVGYLVTSFFTYLWHRATHRSALLWRVFHQLHHSATRMDIAGSTLFHPLDISMYIVVSTVVSTLVLGLSPHAAALTGLVAQFYSFFQHLNVRTPRWLGYFIQRPESHFVHHARELHAFNYSDLPLWDMLFGTFRNPAEFGDGDVGFAGGAEKRVGAMLAFVDVSESIGARAHPPLSDGRGA